MRQWLLLSFLTISGCGSSIVGGECAEGFTACDGQCVDLESNRFHCGRCGNRCQIGEVCIAATCSEPSLDSGVLPDGALADGEVPDGELPDGTVEDGAFPDATLPDGAFPDGALPDGAFPDGSQPDGATGDGGTPVCACDLGERCCDMTCVRPDRDRNHCGMCGNACAGGEFCSDGTCTPVCDPPLQQCGDECVDFTDDPDNCGGCGNVCGSGICIESECSAGIPGHVVLIGHDYRVSAGRRSMQRIAGNAAFIARGATIEVLAYEGDALMSSINGVHGALDRVASDTGRMWNRTVAPTAADVPALLGDADVFIVYSQANADDADLVQLGMDWQTALSSFLTRGGVVMVFDGGGTHEGTWQVLDAAGLLDVSGRTPINGINVTLVARTDALAAGVSVMYRAENESVRFDTMDEVVVVEHPEGPVVIHRTLIP